jgi:hypothetical protein
MSQGDYDNVEDRLLLSSGSRHLSISVQQQQARSFRRSSPALPNPSQFLRTERLTTSSMIRPHRSKPFCTVLAVTITRFISVSLYFIYIACTHWYPLRPIHRQGSRFRRCNSSRLVHVRVRCKSDCFCSFSPRSKRSQVLRTSLH